jgi:hypothetical protein
VVLSQERLTSLGKLLSISQDSAAAVCLRIPRLLTVQPKELSQRLAAASKLLGVEQRLLKDVAALQPGLLVHQTDVLRWACNA